MFYHLTGFGSILLYSFLPQEYSTTRAPPPPRARLFARRRGPFDNRHLDQRSAQLEIARSLPVRFVSEEETEELGGGRCFKLARE